MTTSPPGRNEGPRSGSGLSRARDSAKKHANGARRPVAPQGLAARPQPARAALPITSACQTTAAPLPAAAELNPHDVDLQALTDDLTALRSEIQASLTPADYASFNKIRLWGRLCSIAGYMLAWVAPNPVSALLLSQANFTRWATVMHHISHRGYDRVPGVPARDTSGQFAVGWRRFVDWLDWIHPDAWRHEHNTLHHYNLGQNTDPDLVEDNLGFMRNPRLPMAVRYLITAFFAATWKLTYYAPNTYYALVNKRNGIGHVPTERTWRLWSPFTANGRSFWMACIFPYALYRFVLVPSLFLVMSPYAATCVLINSILGELCANLQSFIVIAPNHCGDDVYRFEARGSGKGEFYRRQIVGSVNYETGSDLKDFLLGGLNYQIEHHVWPDLPLSAYQKYQPRLKALCAKHGLPYTQQGVLVRLGKFVDIMVGRACMLRWTPTNAQSPAPHVTSSSLSAAPPREPFDRAVFGASGPQSMVGAAE